MNYEYYRIFYYVAKYGNITQAAAALMSNQPNVTRVLNNLEHELGCRLFVRSNRGVVLTPEGDRLYRHAAIAFEQLRKGEEEIGRQAALQEGTVYIGASETALHLLLLSVLGEFHRAYPHIHLKIMNYSTPQAMEALKSGQIDFAVVTGPVKGQGQPAYREICLKQFRDILVGGREFAFLAEKQLSLKELVSYPLICMEKDTITHALYRDFFLAHGLELTPDIEVATMDLILPMVKNGLGIGFLARVFAKEALAQKEVVPISLQEELPTRHISLVYDPGRSLSIAADTLKERLCQSGEDNSAS